MHFSSIERCRAESYFQLGDFFLKETFWHRESVTRGELMPGQQAWDNLQPGWAPHPFFFFFLQELSVPTLLSNREISLTPSQGSVWPLPGLGLLGLDTRPISLLQAMGMLRLERNLEVMCHLKVTKT